MAKLSVTAALLLAIPAGAQVPASAPPALDVLDYAFAITLPDTGAVITGDALLTVARTRGDTLVLDLVALPVDGVRVDARDAAAVRDDSTLRIPLPPGAADTLRVEVRWHGAPTDGLIIGRDEAGAWIAFGDNWPTRARDWLPTVDRPADKATVTWRVTAPDERAVIANGALVSRGPAPGAPGRTLTTWRESRPVPTYVMVIGAGPLVERPLAPAACGRSALARCVPESAWVLAADTARLPGPFARASAMTSWFAAMIAPFPFEKLAHVESSTRFGGMENASAIFYPAERLHDGTLEPSVVAHETAHQWFGDAVTPHTFAHLWLSEGFATYWAALWTEHVAGDSALAREMARTRTRIIASPVTAARPIVDTAEANYLRLLNTNSYEKGAWVLHMLRSVVGDSAFFRGLRRYYAAHRYGNAVTDDLRRATEAEAGRPLDWFFDEWLRRPGFVELAWRWRYDPSRHRVSLWLEQGARFAPYRFPLTVEVRDANAGERRVTVEVAAEPSQRVELPIRIDAEPRSVLLDPDVRLLASLVAR